MRPRSSLSTWRSSLFPERERLKIAFQGEVSVPDIAFRLDLLAGLLPMIHGREDFVSHPVWLRNNPPPRATCKRGRGHALIRRLLFSLRHNPLLSSSPCKVNGQGRSPTDLTLLSFEIRQRPTMAKMRSSTRSESRCSRKLPRGRCVSGIVAFHGFEALDCRIDIALHQRK